MIGSEHAHNPVLSPAERLYWPRGTDCAIYPIRQCRTTSGGRPVFLRSLPAGTWRSGHSGLHLRSL